MDHGEHVISLDVQPKLYEEIKCVVGTNENAMVREKDLLRMPYLKAMVLEGLRQHSPGHFVLPHTVLEKAEFEGYQIPKGVAVTFAVTKIGWDGVVWTKPMEFRPERFLERGGREGGGGDGHNQGPEGQDDAVQGRGRGFPLR